MQASQLLQRMSLCSKEYSPKQFLSHARRRLSATLQNSNANLALMALQELHQRQYLRHPGRALAQWDRRGSASARPVSSDRLAARLSATLGWDDAGVHGDTQLTEAEQADTAAPFVHFSRTDGFGVLHDGGAALTAAELEAATAGTEPSTADSRRSASVQADQAGHGAGSSQANGVELEHSGRLAELSGAA